MAYLVNPKILSILIQTIFNKKHKQQVKHESN